MKKFLYGAMALMLTFFAVTGCDDKNNKNSSDASGNNLVAGSPDEDVTLKEEDMPYGATMYQINTGNDDHVRYATEFDKRFFGGDDMGNPDLREVYRIHDYVLAVNTNDHELMKSLYYPEYLENICKQNGYDSVESYLDDLYDSNENVLGEGFEINFINISNCLSEDSSEASYYFQTVENAVNSFDSSLNDKITSKKVIEIGGYTSYTVNDGSYTLTNHADPIILGVYEVDGEVYLF